MYWEKNLYPSLKGRVPISQNAGLQTEKGEAENGGQRHARARTQSWSLTSPILLKGVHRRQDCSLQRARYRWKEMRNVGYLIQSVPSRSPACLHSGGKFVKGILFVRAEIRTSLGMFMCLLLFRRTIHQRTGRKGYFPSSFQWSTVTYVIRSTKARSW